MYEAAVGLRSLLTATLHSLSPYSVNFHHGSAYKK
jgi:DNA-binding CsgD family transcriptional regulator